MSLELIAGEDEHRDMFSSSSSHTTPTIAIRPATADDALAVRRLAALDSRAHVPSGELLVGVVDGEIRAALPVSGGRPIADPFHLTSELVAHLELRAAKLRACRPAPADRRHARTAVRGRTARGLART